MSIGAQQRKVVYAFGPFRVDPEKEKLFRDGKPVPLTPKALQILLVLLRHGPEVVSKDALMKAVWPDTFVEEANLSRNIFLLRKALGEGPQDHCYVITVPGRGYRLAEDVRLVPEREVSIVVAAHSKIQVEVKESRPWGQIAALAAVAAAVIAVAAGAARLFWHRSPMLTERDTVVLADFVNSTGDSVFDGTLRQGLAVQLEQSPFLSLVSEPRIRQTLKMMGKGSDVPLTVETAREVCERTGGAVVLEGSIARLGTQYVVGLKSTNCRTGEVLDEQQAQVNKKEEVLNAVGQMASLFRRRAGESLATLLQHDKPLEEATTSSLEALKAYSAAVNVGFSRGFTEGIPLLQRAIEIDPTFALAHAHLGLWYSAIGEQQLAIEETKKAYKLREHTSDRENLFIAAIYQRDVTGNLEKQLQTLNTWVRMYPRDSYPHGLLSGFGDQGLGRYEESIEEANTAIALDPDFGPGYINRAFSQFYLGRLDEADKALQRAAEKRLELPELMVLRYLIAFFRGNRAEMEAAATAAKGKPGAEDWMLHASSLVAAHDGQLQQARELSRQAIEMARQHGNKEKAATYTAAAAVWNALYGETAAAKRDSVAALALSNGRDVEYAAAFALAQVGDISRAEMLANDLGKRFPEDTSVQFSYLPALRGMFALKRRDPAGALDELQIAQRQERAQTGLGFFAFMGNMYPAYVRGQAYIALGKTKEAQAEFRKFVDYPGIVMGDPMGPLARREISKLNNEQQAVRIKAEGVR